MKNMRFCHHCGHGLDRKWVEGRTRLFCRRCDMPIYENPIPATCLVVVDEAQRILMVRRSVDPKKGQWCLPGGFMELGELPEDAALRELREETGLRGKIEMLLGVMHAPSDAYDSILMVGYLVKTASGALRAGDDASDVRWFAMDEFPEVAFRSHRKFIRMFEAGFSSTIRLSAATP